MIIKAVENRDKATAEILCNKCAKIITIVTYRMTPLDKPQDKDKLMLYYMALSIRNNFMFDKLAFEKEAIVVDNKHICKTCWDKREGSIEDMVKDWA